VATFSTFVALFSHVLAGGALPGMLGIAVPLVFSTVASVLLAGRRLSLTRLTISVAISQFLFHTLFVLGASGGSASVAPMAPGHVMGGAGMGGAVMIIDASGSPAMTVGAHDGPWMWVAHVVAGLITITALHLSETIATRLADGKRFVLSLLQPVIPTLSLRPIDLTLVAIGFREALPLPLGVYPSTVSRRGPPALVFP
jgi:hypothetical protein